MSAARTDASANAARDHAAAIDAALAERIDAAAQTARLLAASDFDGTLAPLVDDPGAARAHPAALAALRTLAALPATHAAILSGRALADLAARTAEVEGAIRVGSHGAEFGHAVAAPLTPDQAVLRERVTERLRELAGRAPGLVLEEKPVSLALHYRQATQEVAAAAVEAVQNGPAGWPGVVVRHGKMVVELSVVWTHKGAAMRRIRDETRATAVVFFGDDATDEDAFAALTNADLGVKVGAGASVAPYRVATTDDVVRCLATLAERRAAWVGVQGQRR